LTALFFVTVPNFLGFSRLSGRKFNEDSKNVLKNLIRSLQVEFTGDFVADCSLNRYFCSLNFDSILLLDCTKFLSVFLGCRIENLKEIPKMCLKI